MAMRVVITGLGVISPVGTGKEKFWKALISGKNGVKVARKIDTRLYDTHMAAEVDDFIPEKFVDFSKISHPTTATLYAIAAVQMALKDAQFKVVSGREIGIVLGANTPDPLAHAAAIFFWNKHKYGSTPAKIYDNLHSNLHVVKAAEYFGLKGPASVIPSACAAGNTTISYAFHAIKSGYAQAMLAGGCEPMNHSAFGGFDKMRAMAPKICQPFDKNRKGMIVGEGGGVVLLEEMQHALKRKAKIYGEILGYGLATDAYSVAIPHPEGVGAFLATKMALKMSRIKPSDVDYVNAHGTGTIANDRMESKVIHAIFKKNGNDVLVSSIKSMVGHCMGAASVIEACASALTIERDIIPPNINYVEPDPKCDIHVVANKAIKKKINVMISNSFAFGGNNAVIVIAKFKRHL